MSPLLNLSENESAEFEALPPGRYFANVFEIEEREIQGENGKLPKGTPMIWIHFQITGRVGEDEGPNEESPYWNRRAFRNLVVPPEELNGKKYEHYKKMNGMIVRFFISLGHPEEEVTSGSFDPDLEDEQGKELIIQLNRRKNTQTDEMDNNVVGFRSIEEVAGVNPSGLL